MKMSEENVGGGGLSSRTGNPGKCENCNHFEEREPRYVDEILVSDGFCKAYQEETTTGISLDCPYFKDKKK